MSDTLIIGLVAVIPLIIAQVANLIVGIRTSRKTDAQTVKIDKQTVETAKISVATDGTLSSLTKTLEVANQEIKGLKYLISEMNASKKDAKDLADKLP